MDGFFCFSLSCIQHVKTSSLTTHKTHYFAILFCYALLEDKQRTKVGCCDKCLSTPNFVRVIMYFTFFSYNLILLLFCFFSFHLILLLFYFLFSILIFIIILFLLFFIFILFLFYFIFIIIISF